MMVAGLVRLPGGEGGGTDGMGIVGEGVAEI